VLNRNDNFCFQEHRVTIERSMQPITDPLPRDNLPETRAFVGVNTVTNGTLTYFSALLGARGVGEVDSLQSDRADEAEFLVRFAVTAVCAMPIICDKQRLVLARTDVELHPRRSHAAG
jgi:hypothetical protein